MSSKTLIDGVTKEEIPEGDYLFPSCSFCKQTNIAATYYRYIIEDRQTLFLCATCKDVVFPSIE